jgi:MFS family permease
MYHAAIVTGTESIPKYRLAAFYPAQPAIIPQLVGEKQLQTGNVLIQGTAQLGLFAGPVIAGVLIALLDSGSARNGAANMHGIAIAFGVDALSFLASVVSLWMIRLNARKEMGDAAEQKESTLSSIRAGLVHAWNDFPVRLLIFNAAAITLLINGPFAVSIPVLSATRYAGGAAAFGIIMSVFGSGALLGIVLAGVLPKPPSRHIISTVLAVMSSLGIAMALLGLATSTLFAALLPLAMGTASGYINIMLFTWLQKRTPPEMQGRMMSLAMFVALGLNPVSMPIAGVLIKLNPTLFLLGAGVLMATVSLLAALNFLLHEKDMKEPVIAQAENI